MIEELQAQWEAFDPYIQSVALQRVSDESMVEYETAQEYVTGWDEEDQVYLWKDLISVAAHYEHELMSF